MGNAMEIWKKNDIIRGRNLLEFGILWDVMEYNRNVIQIME